MFCLRTLFSHFSNVYQKQAAQNFCLLSTKRENNQMRSALTNKVFGKMVLLPSTKRAEQQQRQRQQKKKSGDRHDNTQYKTELLCPAKCVLLSHSLRSIHLVCTIWIGADRQLDRSAKIKITQKKNPLPMSCFGYIFTRPIHRHVVHKNCVFHIADTHRQANILCERIQRAMRVKREWTRTCSAFNVKTEKKVLVMIIVSNYISIIMAQKHIEWNTQFMSD